MRKPSPNPVPAPISAIGPWGAGLPAWRVQRSAADSSSIPYPTATKSLMIAVRGIPISAASARALTVQGRLGALQSSPTTGQAMPKQARSGRLPASSKNRCTIGASPA